MRVYIFQNYTYMNSFLRINDQEINVFLSCKYKYTVGEQGVL